LVCPEVGNHSPPRAPLLTRRGLVVARAHEIFLQACDDAAPTSARASHSAGCTCKLARAGWPAQAGCAAWNQGDPSPTIGRRVRPPFLSFAAALALVCSTGPAAAQNDPVDDAVHDPVAAFRALPATSQDAVLRAVAARLQQDTDPGLLRIREL